MVGKGQASIGLPQEVGFMQASLCNFSSHILLQDGWTTKGLRWKRPAPDPSTAL